MTRPPRDHLGRWLVRDHGQPEAGACPSADELGAYFDGGLSDEERAALEAHAFGCVRCRETLALLARAESAAAPVPAAVPSSRPVPRLSGPGRGASLRHWALPLAACFVLIAGWATWRFGRADEALPSAGTTSARLEQPAAGVPEVRSRPPAPPAEPPASRQPAFEPPAPQQTRDQAAPPAGAGSLALRDRAEDPPAGTGADEKVAAEEPVAERAEPSVTRAIAEPPAADTFVAAATEEARREDASPATPLGQQARTDAVAPPRSEGERPARSEPAAVAAPRELAPEFRTAAPATQAAERRERQGAVAGTIAVEVASPDGNRRWRVGPGGIEGSLDGGRTWVLEQAGRFEVDAGSSPAPGVCWLAGRGGLVLRVAGESGWRDVSLPERADAVRITARSADEAEVVTSDGGRYLTGNGGRDWRRVPPPLFEGDR